MGGSEPGYPQTINFKWLIVETANYMFDLASHFTTCSPQYIRPQNMMGDNGQSDKRVFFWIYSESLCVRYPESRYQSVPLWELATSLVSSQQEIDPEIPKTYPAKCSMLAMFISDKMWPRSHSCQVAPTHIPRCESVNVKPGTWHLLSIKLEAPPSPFFTFPETSCVRNFPGSQFN